MPTETSIWQRPADLCNGGDVEPFEAFASSHYGLIAVQSSPWPEVDPEGWTPEFRGVHRGAVGTAEVVLRYEWVFDAKTAAILKTPNDTLVLRNGYSLNADGREIRALDGGTTFVAEDAIAVTGSNEPPAPDLPSVDRDVVPCPPLVEVPWQGIYRGEVEKLEAMKAEGATQAEIDAQHEAMKGVPSSDQPDDGWSVAARLTGADVEALRQAAEHIGDGAVLVGGRAGDHVVGWMDRGEHSSEAKWVFDAKTARMLKGPELLQPTTDGQAALEALHGGPARPGYTLSGRFDHGVPVEATEVPMPGFPITPALAVEQRETTELEQARAAIVRRIIAAGDDEVEEIEALAKAYDLLR